MADSEAERRIRENLLTRIQSAQTQVENAIREACEAAALGVAHPGVLHGLRAAGGALSVAHARASTAPLEESRG